MLNSERWMMIAQVASISGMNRSNELEDDDFWEDELYSMYNREERAANSLAIQWKGKERKGIENVSQG